MRRVSYLPSSTSNVQGGKRSPCHVKQLWLLSCTVVGFLVWGLFLNNLVDRQNLSLERGEGTFPRETGKGGEMICLRCELVKIVKLRVSKALEEIKQ